MSRITGMRVLDVRFPTSRSLDGSDAMNPDPDYSAAYVILDTDTPDIRGHGLAFTIVQLGVSSFQERVESRGVVGLPRGQMKVERVALAIAKNVDFCGKPPARTA